MVTTCNRCHGSLNTAKVYFGYHWTNTLIEGDAHPYREYIVNLCFGCILELDNEISDIAHRMQAQLNWEPK